MNKKDAIRTYLLTMGEGSKFQAHTLAEWVNKENRRKDITPKDVDNTILPLFKAGALTRERKGQGIWVYGIAKNNIQLWFAKHPIVGAAQRGTGQKTLPTATVPARKKNRSPFVISIDAEIADLQCKIKRLNAIRKEFA